jgi:hypothetical protein
MPTKYLHTRLPYAGKNATPKQKTNLHYETTLKITYGEEGLSPNEVEVSLAVCSPNDMFCRALGRATADSKQPVILPKHKVFKYLEDMGETHKGVLWLPRHRDLAIALLTCNR